MSWASQAISALSELCQFGGAVPKGPLGGIWGVGEMDLLPTELGSVQELHSPECSLGMDTGHGHCISSLLSDFGVS